MDQSTVRIIAAVLVRPSGSGDSDAPQEDQESGRRFLTVAQIASKKPHPRMLHQDRPEARLQFRLRVSKSKIHRWGIYAEEDIPARRKMIEYTGERISRRETKIRASRPLNYIFTLDNYWCIDGSWAEAEPSTSTTAANPTSWPASSRATSSTSVCARLRRVKNSRSITTSARTWNRVECHCGAKGCRGTINLRD